jgi:hypothetical protein
VTSPEAFAPTALRAGVAYGLRLLCQMKTPALGSVVGPRAGGGEDGKVSGFAGLCRVARMLRWGS